MDVAIELIKPSPYQPRLTFDVEDLKEEIRRDGLLSALVVRKRDEYYELLDGERRLRALKDLGWETVPVDLREVDDRIARRSVFKLNSIRENYTTEEKARYFKKLADEKMTAYQIGAELNVDDNWVRAHLNVFLFPDDVQQAVWANQLSVATVRELEPLIGANLEEASVTAREAIARKLTREQVRETLRPRVEEIEKARIEAARKALEVEAEKIGAAAPISLETPEDLKEAAEALRREAKRRELEALTDEDWLILADLKAAQEAEQKAKAEERNRQELEKRRQLEELAMRKARRELRQDVDFVKEAWDRLPSEARDQVIGISPEERERLERARPPTTPMDSIYEVDNLAERLYHRLGELDVIPSAGIAILGTTLRSLQDRIKEVLNRMGLYTIEGESKLIGEDR